MASFFRGFFGFRAYYSVEAKKKGGICGVKETEIIELIRAREEHGARELLTHYGPMLRYIVSPILPDGQDREECVSEIVMRVWERIESFDPERGSWKAWLTAIARNAALSRARKNRGEAQELTEDILSLEPTPEQALLLSERRKALAGALKRLSARDFELFYRKYYYRQSTAQIAAEVGLTERAVEGRLYRIKKRLRDELGGEAHD